nr:MAG TPA: hypothetical protein [Caudoviricetes sp.]
MPIVTRVYCCLWAVLRLGLCCCVIFYVMIYVKFLCCG